LSYFLIRPDPIKWARPVLTEIIAKADASVLIDNKTKVINMFPAGIFGHAAVKFAA